MKIQVLEVESDQVETELNKLVEKGWRPVSHTTYWSKIWGDLGRMGYGYATKLMYSVILIYEQI